MLSAGLIILPSTVGLGKGSAIRLGRAELPCTCPCVVAPAQLLPEVPPVSDPCDRRLIPHPHGLCGGRDESCPYQTLQGEKEMHSWKSADGQTWCEHL